MKGNTFDVEAVEFCQDFYERVLRFKPEGFAISVLVTTALAGIATARTRACSRTKLKVFAESLGAFQEQLLFVSAFGIFATNGFLLIASHKCASELRKTVNINHSKEKESGNR